MTAVMNRSGGWGYKYRREPLTQYEEEKLVAEAKEPREKLVVWGLLDSGLRVSELAKLKRANVDFRSKEMVIWGKGKKRRVVPLTERMKGLLEHWFAIHEEVGISRRTIERIVEEVAQRAGITTKKVTPHVLRHTFACNCLRDGMLLTTLKDILGHEDMMTTSIYLRMQPEYALKDFKEKWGKGRER